MPMYNNNTMMSPYGGNQNMYNNNNMGYNNNPNYYGASSREPYNPMYGSSSPNASYFGRYQPRYGNQQQQQPYDGYGPEPLYYQDRVFDDERVDYERPTYRKSKMLANPDFGNYHFKKGFTAEVWLNDGETVVLQGDSRKKTYRSHYSPELFRSFFFGWLGRLLRYFYLDRLFGLHIDTIKTVKTKNYIFVTAHVLPT